MTLKYTILKLSLCVLMSIPAFLITTAYMSSSPAYARSAPDNFADLAEKLLPAVVNISSTQKIENPVDMPEFPQFPEGSQFEDFFEEFMDQRGHPIPSIPPASLG